MIERRLCHHVVCLAPFDATGLKGVVPRPRSHYVRDLFVAKLLRFSPQGADIHGVCDSLHRVQSEGNGRCYPGLSPIGTLGEMSVGPFVGTAGVAIEDQREPPRVAMGSVEVAQRANRASPH